MNSSARRLILALRRLNSELSTSNRRIAAQTGLNPADLAILDVVHREGAQSATTLARRTVTPLATMTGVLKRLERDGWVVRRPDSDDGRAVVIDNVDSRHLTAAYAPVNRELAALATRWTEPELAVIIDFLDHVSSTVHGLNTDLPADAVAE